MADLDNVTGAALCQSLEEALAAEIGALVVCRDVSAQSLRWDVVAYDSAGMLVRRISHTSTVPERMAMAGAELRDLRTALQRELRGMEIAGIEIALHSRQLPTRRNRRYALGRALAARVRDSILTGAPVIEDPLVVLRSGGQLHDDPIADAFSRVEIWPTRADRPACVRLSGDHRLGFRVPELHEEVLPAVAEKRARHGALTPDLTLIVEPVLADITAQAVRELRQKLQPSHGGFCSVYVGRLDGEVFPLARIY